VGWKDAAVPDPIATARAEGRTLLTEVESKELLGAAGIPVIPTRFAGSADRVA
jgi:acetyltransferase